MSSVFKHPPVVPQLHKSANDPLCFTVGSGSFDPGELLFDTMFITHLHKSMILFAFILLAVVRVSDLDQVRAFFGHLSQEHG